MNLAKFGAKLRQVREEQHLTQEDVVGRLGRKTPAAISGYENGRRNLYAVDLPDYARALGVSIQALFEDSLSDDDLDLALLDWFKRLPRDKKRRVFEYIVNSVPYIIGGQGDRHTLNDERLDYPNSKTKKP